MNSTFKSIYEVLLIPLNFLPFDTKCVFCPKRVSAEILMELYIKNRDSCLKTGMKLGHLSETAKEEFHCGFGLQWGELQSLSVSYLYKSFAV